MYSQFKVKMRTRRVCGRAGRPKLTMEQDVALEEYIIQHPLYGMITAVEET